MKRYLSALIFCAGLCSFAPELAAQAVYGSIVGTVTDSTGGSINGAKVTITSLERQVTETATTNESGNYLQRNLIVGRYRIRVEASGFKAFQQDANVSVDTEIRVDAKLELGAISETVEVTAEAGIIKTERADVATTYNENTISTIPLVGRRFTQLQLYTPGNAVPSNGLAYNAEVAGGQPFNVPQNGQRSTGSGYMLDGTDHHDAILSILVFQPTLESLAEVKVTTSSFDAELGNAASGVISATTKSGTNSTHGSLFEYLRNDALQARNPYTQSRINPATGRAIPVGQWNQFGGSIGGKIIKNKLFYFGDYQGTRRNIGGSIITRVPTLAERRGDMSGLGRTIYNPLSSSTLAGRTPFSGNVIPQAQLSQQAQNLLKLIPLPNIASAVLDQPNYLGAGKTKETQDVGNGRIDYYVSDKMHVFGRYSVAEFDLSAPGVFGQAGGSGFDPSGSTQAAFYSGTAQNHHISLASGADYTLSPSLFTDFRFGFFRYFIEGQSSTIGTNGAKTAGIPGLNNDEVTNDMPTFWIRDYANDIFRFGSGLLGSGQNAPLYQNEKQIQFVNNWTKVKGDHTIKFGGDFRRAFNLRVPSDRHRSGEMQFYGAGTQGASGGGSGMATFLLGNVSFLQRYVGGTIADDNAETQNRFFFFGQDTWKISRKLTFNYGLRWEIYQPQTVNAVGHGGNLDLGTGEVATWGVGNFDLAGNVQNRLTLSAPRLGLAYSLNDKTVIRAGYGRGFSMGAFGSIFGHSSTQDLPVLASQTLVGSNNFDAAFTMASGPGPVLNPATILTNQPKGPNGLPILPNGQTMFVDKNQITLPTVDSWNFSVQRQVTGTMSFEAAYVGNIGVHMYTGGSDYDPNQPTIVGFGTLSQNQRKPYFIKACASCPGGTLGWTQNFRYFGSDSTMRYQSLQLKFEKRFSSGLNLLSHFTWSKAFDYQATYYPVDATYARGLQDFNRAKAFFLTATYQLPFGKGKKFGANWSRPLDLIAGGWQTNYVWQWYSGLPVTNGASGGPSYQNCSADEDVGICRPNVVGDFHVANQSQSGWFATCPSGMTTNGQVCGAWQRPQKGQLGNAGRNYFLFGPQFQQLDMSLFKTFKVTERFDLQFRAEGYNIANHTNLGQPNPCVDCAGVAGRIFNTAAAYSPRLWQFALRVGF